MSIIIFSRPIHSGKTTQLMKWCNLKKNIYGVLMPDINNFRKIYNIKTKEIFDIECTEAGDSKEPLTTVGRFNFYTAAFEKANSIIISALSQDTDWLVIDEAGKLELEKKGFYKAIVEVAEKYNSNEKPGNLLVTVRESLCNEVISFFNFSNCRIITQLEELPIK